MSTFDRLATPVTWAPMAFAIWTANGPTLPDAPTTSTRSPALGVRPLRVRSPCSASTAECGSVDACTKSMPVRQRGEGFFLGDDVLGERPPAVVGQVGHHRVAWLPSGHAGAHHIHLACDVPSHPWVARRPHPQEKAHEAGFRLEPVEVRPVDRCRPHPDPHLPLPRLRHLDVTNLNDFRSAVPIALRGLHGSVVVVRRRSLKRRNTPPAITRTGSAISSGRGSDSESGSTKTTNSPSTRGTTGRRSTCSLPLPKPVQRSDGSPFHAASTRYRAPSSNVDPHDAPLDAVTISTCARSRPLSMASTWNVHLTLSALDDGNAGRSTRIAVPVKMTSAFRLCSADVDGTTVHACAIDAISGSTVAAKSIPPSNGRTANVVITRQTWRTDSRLAMRIVAPPWRTSDGSSSFSRPCTNSGSSISRLEQ